MEKGRWWQQGCGEGHRTALHLEAAVTHRPGPMLGSWGVLFLPRRPENERKGPPKGYFEGRSGCSGLKGMVDHQTLEVAVPAVSMWKPVLPTLAKRPEVSKGGSSASGCHIRGFQISARSFSIQHSAP